jgi:hypothetical protein
VHGRASSGKHGARRAARNTCAYVSDLPTHDRGCVQVELPAADSAPDAIVVHLELAPVVDGEAQVVGLRLVALGQLRASTGSQGERAGAVRARGGSERVRGK